MGCGASKDPKIAVSDSKGGKNKISNTDQNGFKKSDIKFNKNNQLEQSKPATAFVISFDDKNGNLNRPPPGRLRLEPLKNVPKVTKDDIDDKIKSAEIKRERILAERGKSGKSKKNANYSHNTSLDRFEMDSYQNDYSKKREDSREEINFQKKNNFNNDYLKRNNFDSRDDYNSIKKTESFYNDNSYIRKNNSTDDIYNDHQIKDSIRNDKYLDDVRYELDEERKKKILNKKRIVTTREDVDEDEYEMNSDKYYNKNDYSSNNRRY